MIFDFLDLFARWEKLDKLPFRVKDGAVRSASGPAEITIRESSESDVFFLSPSRRGVEVEIAADAVEIGDEAFAGFTGMRKVIIPEGVKRIGRRAFAGCTGLTSAEIPAGVTFVADDAFSGCSVTLILRVLQNSLALFRFF